MLTFACTSPSHEPAPATSTPPPIDAPSTSPTQVVVERAAAELVLKPSTASCFDEHTPNDWLPRIPSHRIGLHGPAIDRLIAEATASESDALLIIKQGKIVVERSSTAKVEPMETRSITKSVAAMAILALVADGRIPSLDEPMATFFSELGEGDKAAITLRHVLTHSSGLAHAKTDANKLNAQHDRLAYVRSLPVETPAGTRFSYSNEATQLLAGVIAQAAGVPFDVYARKRLFDPIGVGEVGWARDRAGGIQTYYGLRMTARDLGRLGLLLLHGGRFGDRQVLPRALVREAWAPSPTSLSYGLLFWRRSNLRQVANIDAEVPGVVGLARFADRVFRSEVDYFTILGNELDGAARDRVAGTHRGGRFVLSEPPGGDLGFYAVGGLGQRLAVYPRAGIVAVRQHRRRAGDNGRAAKVSWRAFFDHVEALDPRLSR